jgi:hypothetical protein
MEGNKVVQPGTRGIYQEEWKQLARHQKGKIVERKNRLETFNPLIHTECKL